MEAIAYLTVLILIAAITVVIVDPQGLNDLFFGKQLLPPSPKPLPPHRSFEVPELRVDPPPVPPTPDEGTPCHAPKPTEPEFSIIQLPYPPARRRTSTNKTHSKPSAPSWMRYSLQNTRHARGPKRCPFCPDDDRWFVVPGDDRCYRCQ